MRVSDAASISKTRGEIVFMLLTERPFGNRWGYNFFSVTESLASVSESKYGEDAPDEIIADALLLKARKGDDDAAREIFRALYPGVRRIVRNHLPPRQSEEELCQMVFVKVFSKLDQYSGRVPISHWVSRIAVNTCLNELKKQSRRPEIRETDLGDGDIALIARLEDPAWRSEEDAAVARELVERLFALLAPADRLVLSLLYLEGRTVAEISESTGFSQVGVKVRAHRARLKLQQALRRWTEL